MAEPDFKTEKLKLEALAKIDLVKGFEEFSKRFEKSSEAKENFLALYNSGEYYTEIYKILGKVSYSSLWRWATIYAENNNYEDLIPKYKCTKISEYNTKLTPEMIEQFEKFLFHPNKFKVEKAINLTKFCLERKGITDIPANIAFRRYADKFKVLHYDKWVLYREGEKAFNDKVEPYIERDISKIEVGDVLVADGHVLNFQVINPFTGKPTRATLVGFFDWKSSTLIGYEIMMSENTQCIASALRNSIINLDRIPKIVYQDNGKAFRAKYFYDKRGEKNSSRSLTDAKCDFLAKASKNQHYCQNCNFDEAGFNGVYANLGITSVFAKVRNAKAKVIERFFLEFQEELEKMMPSYIGTSIEDKPARLMRGENLHKAHYLKTTCGRIPTIQEAIKCIDFWLNYHNSKPCPHDKSLSIKECLNTVQKQFIDKNTLNHLMMKTETKVIHRNGIRFLDQNYYNEALFGLREQVYIRYSLFDLSKVFVYSIKGEFICTAKQVEKIHPMANYLGTVKDMEDFKQKIQKHKRLKKKAIKEFNKYFDIETTGILEIPKEVPKIEEFKLEKPKRERKLTPREQQMNKPIFNHDYEKYEWLMTHGTTNPEDRKWLENYLKSEEYQSLYTE